MQNAEQKARRKYCKVPMVYRLPLKGSGESAAKILAQNGIAIKISQDGAIKIYFGENNWFY